MTFIKEYELETSSCKTRIRSKSTPTIITKKLNSLRKNKAKLPVDITEEMKIYKVKINLKCLF